jgi:hypothetical protein
LSLLPVGLRLGGGRIVDDFPFRGKDIDDLLANSDDAIRVVDSLEGDGIASFPPGLLASWPSDEALDRPVPVVTFPPNI